MLNTAGIDEVSLHLHFHKSTETELTHLNFQRKINFCFLLMKPEVNLNLGDKMHIILNYQYNDV